MKRTIQSPPKKNASGNNTARAQATSGDLSYPPPDRQQLNSPLGGIAADLVIETAVAQSTAIPPDELKVFANVDDACRSLNLPPPARSSISVRDAQLNHAQRQVQSEASSESCAEQYPKQQAITHLNSSHNRQVYGGGAMDYQICEYRNQLWLIKDVDPTTNKLTIAPPNSERMLLVDSAEVRLMSVEEAIAQISQPERPAQNKPDLTAPPLDTEHEPCNKIQIDDISFKQMSEAATRHHAIKSEIDGIISVQVAAEMCDLSLSRYHQIKRLFDPHVGFRTLVSQRRGRKPKALKPPLITQPTPATPEAPATPATPEAPEAPRTNNPNTRG